MAKAKPKFVRAGFCVECGNRTLVNSVGICEVCWKNKQKEKKEAKKGMNKQQTIREFLAPYVEQLNNGDNPTDILMQILEDGGYEVVRQEAFDEVEKPKKSRK